MGLAGIELAFLVKEISERTAGYYVNNIYPINQNSVLFKLHHPDKPDLFLVISSIGMWFTGIKIDAIEDNKLVKRLRDDLLRLKIVRIEQIGVERIAYLTFSGFDKEFVLICEFFGDGNIMLCNKDLKVLALLHSIAVRHREIRVGSIYAPPPQKGLNIFDISSENFTEIKSISTPIAKWFGRTYGLPTKYAQEILRIANVDFDLVCQNITDQQIERIILASKTLTNDIVSGNHNPVIVKSDDEFDVYPISSTIQDTTQEQIPSFMEGLDKIFSNIILDKGKLVKSGSIDKKIADLQSKIDEQTKAISLVKEKSEKISSVAKSLYSFSSYGVSSILDSPVAQILKASNAELIKDRGILFLKIDDEKIQINSESSFPAIASTIFNEAKRQSSAIELIESLKIKNLKELEKLKSQSQETKKAVFFTEFKKKEWFERYRWFNTSDGLLAIGGRDSSSNSAIIRKQLTKNDKVFHAEIFGSPFFILKDVPDSLPFDSLNEVAQATVCFSRAWREAMYGMSAYWINPEQVKKAAPSGQFLSRGSFVLEGHKNFIKAPNLRLAVGVQYHDERYILTCGPPEPIKKNCICYAIIEPGLDEMTDCAKRVRTEFIKLQEDIAKQFDIDDYVRVLPAGESHIVESGNTKVEPA
ncbi:MAG TPA: fibronectin-binding domain-containing protein [Candidatus Nitrosotenuis sp.]|jgi:predicted ribosome quality control (RQC) complex YloA/Tae2 family protein|nr:fibronectin-binding domain-containing protein [Candidatus Nitrosotenuis sp.]HIH45732.1 fibronectin-binding domain-containing protein [Candidatus Nitrosotenuis sp.]HIH68618.1 fibronectin-binding domain-containing protein [Candidatus Nitrosotenuis sp.]HII04045.1 fibronectin-binding domain-containing protein [Candidatus Nitrosotenuis sp.]